MNPPTSHWDPDAAPIAAAGDAFTAEQYLGPSPRPGSPAGRGTDAPQAFLVEMGPGTLLRTHFHPIDQFQVFVRGGGRFARHDVGHGAIHYADGNTPYGPLVAGGRGVGFLTLRARTDSGAAYMPESRSELEAALAGSARPAGTRRNRSLPAAWSCRANRWRWQMDEADGARAGRLTLDPDAVGQLPAIAGAGAHLIALAGSVEVGHPHESAAGGSLRWLSPGTAAQAITAGGQGALVVLVQLPVPADPASPVTSPPSAKSGSVRAPQRCRT